MTEQPDPSLFGDLSPRQAKELVRRGYEAASYHYRRDHDVEAGERQAWIERLTARLAPGAAVLDLGCGCGVPVSRQLAESGFRVTGVDLSDVQIERARQLVGKATFVRADAATVELPAAGFDAILCLYMFIHLPLVEQPGLLARMASWLRPGGWLVATTGHTAWTGTASDWLGSGAAMWWSHADAVTYRAWLSRAGFAIEEEQFVPEGDDGHALFWARRIIA